jgi:hypothetical protein
MCPPEFAYPQHLAKVVHVGPTSRRTLGARNALNRVGIAHRRLKDKGRATAPKNTDTIEVSTKENRAGLFVEVGNRCQPGTT